MITEAEARAVAEAGYADIMLAHDAPDYGTTKVQEIINTPPHVSGWSDSGLRYAKEGRTLMNIAFAGVKPKLFAHGHYHVFDATERGATKFLALACDGMHGNVAILHLDTLELDLLTV